MVHRERVRQWKLSEMNIITQAFSSSGNMKLFEQIGEYASTIMSMALHSPGAYHLEQKPDIKVKEEKSLGDYLSMLDEMPELNG